MLSRAKNSAPSGHEALGDLLGVVVAGERALAVGDVDAAGRGCDRLLRDLGFASTSSVRSSGSARRLGEHGAGGRVQARPRRTGAASGRAAGSRAPRRGGGPRRTAAPSSPSAAAISATLIVSRFCAELGPERVPVVAAERKAEVGRPPGRGPAAPWPGGSWRRSPRPRPRAAPDDLLPRARRAAGERRVQVEDRVAAAHGRARDEHVAGHHEHPEAVRARAAP